MKLSNDKEKGLEISGKFLKGKAHVYKKDHINTDEIIPARYLTTSKEAELAKHAMEDIDKSFVKKVKKGFETAVALAPENIRFRQALIKFHVNAPSLLGGDTDEALKHALVLKDHDALYGAGALIHVYGETKNKKAFRQWLNETLLEFKKEPEIHYQAGMYYQNEEIYEIAISYFRAAAEIVEVSEQQHQAKYLAMFQIGRTSMLTERNLDEGEKALVQYMSEAKITSAMPSLAWAKFRLANIVEAKGKKQKAIDIYRQVLHSKSTEYVKMLAQERLKSLGQA